MPVQIAIGMKFVEIGVVIHCQNCELAKATPLSIIPAVPKERL